MFRSFSALEIFSAVSFIFLLTLFIYSTFISAENKRPLLSLRSGLYNQPIRLSAYSSIMQTEIRYTLDGSDPKNDSNLYIKPLDMDITTVAKFQLFRNGQKVGNTAQASYFINEESTLPIVSLISDPENLWNEETGIYTKTNQKNTGEEWVRPGVIQFFDGFPKSLAFSKNITYRIYGGETRKSGQKTLKICAGENDSIHYKLFPNSEVTKYKCFLLRNSGGDWRVTMFRDALMQTIASKNSSVTTQNYRPVVLYINGEYWGIHNLREYYNDNFLSNKYGGRREDYSILFPNRENKGRVDIEAGDAKDAEDFYKLREIVKEDMSDPKIMREVESLIDIENFIDYNIFETFFANYDWLDNNTKIWRYTGVDKNDSVRYGNDGKFRWMLYDLDAGFAIYDVPPYKRNILKTAVVKRDYTGREWPYVILRRITENEPTRNMFINRYADHLNSTFLPEKIIAYIDVYEKNLENEMPRHIERWKNSKDAWNNPYIQTLQEWRDNVQKLRDFAIDRPQYAYQHVIEQFGLAGTYTVNISNEENNKGYVVLNSLNIKNESWSGTYFDEVPIKLTAVPYKGYSFAGWQDGNKNTSIVIKSSEDVTIKPNFR